MNETSSSSYRMLFDQSPVSLWVEDFSLIYEKLNNLKAEGITDFRAFFHTSPERFEECVDLLRVIDVNNATLRLYKAASLEDIRKSVRMIFRDEAKTSLVESLIAIAAGRRQFDGQVVNYDLEGNKLHFRINWSIAGDSVEDYKKVIVAMQDMTSLDRVRTELEEREALFRCIFEQATEGMMLMDSAGKIILANSAFSDLTGFPQEDVIGCFLWDFYDRFIATVQLSEAQWIGKDDFLKALANPNMQNTESEYSYFDNKHKLHAHKQTLVPIYSGKETMFALLLTDLTAEKKSEVTTSILHKISHAVNIENSLDGLFKTIHQSLARVIDVTNFFIAMYDPKSNLITFPYLVDEVSEDASPVEADNNTSLTAQIISEARTLLLDEDGINARTRDRGVMGNICKNFLGTPLILSGNVIGAVVVQSYTKSDLYTEEDKMLLESISEQIAYALHKKQADENITILFQAIEQAGEGIIIFSPQGSIQYVNAIFERITSYRRSELLDKPFEYLPFDVSSRKEMQQSWLRVRSSQPWRGKIDMFRKDGPKITLDMVVKPVIDNFGRLSSIIASCKDVTYEILREEQQKRTQRLEAIGRLTGGIAHDFNNILSAVIGYAELAGDDMEPGSDAAMNLLEVLKSAGRAKEMIAQLISFSRQEEAKTEVIELVDHVKESVRFLRSYLPRSIKIVENYTKERCTVVAVPGQVHQIVINLGTNAMHALQKDGAKLELTVETVNFTQNDMQAFPELEQCQYMKVSVADNGTGIDPAIVDHIFDPYFTTKSANEGTGLGLSIVHSIVQSHHGAIRVNSELGVGTTFDIYLPLYTPDVKQPTANETEEHVEKGGHENIMVVDDEPALVNVFRQGLMRLGYKVEGFTDPRKAYEHFAKDPEHIDMVVTDTTMPYMSGVDLAEKVLEIRKDIPVIICTGFTTLISVDDARSRGIRDFVMKPFKIRDIAVRIRNIFDGKDADETGPTAK